MQRMNNKIQFLIIGVITLLAIYFGWSLAQMLHKNGDHATSEQLLAEALELLKG